MGHPTGSSHQFPFIRLNFKIVLFAFLVLVQEVGGVFVVMLELVLFIVRVGGLVMFVP